MQSLEAPASVHLLPLFDAYVLGLGRGRELEPLLARVHQRLVYRPQGWISAVVLVNGYITGVWEYQTRRSQTTVKVQLFSAPTAVIRQGIEAEAARLGAFLNTEVVVANIDTI
jgi:hypothetical protein